MADLIGRCTNKLEEDSDAPGRKLVSASSAPQAAEREALEMRRAELRAALRPDPAKYAIPVIVKLIANGDAFGMSQGEAIEKAKLYAEAASDMPAWALDKARIAFSRPGWKAPWNGRGIPSSADVVAECRAILQPIEAELYRIGQILDAEVVDLHTTPAEREKALDAWAKIRSGIASHSVIAERTPDEIVREREAMRRANTIVRDREARAKARLERELAQPLPADLPTAP